MTTTLLDIIPTTSDLKINKNMRALRNRADLAPKQNTMESG